MRICEGFLLIAVIVLFAIAIPGIGTAAGMGAGGAMMGGGTSGAMPMGGYSSGGLMAGQVGNATDSKDDQPGMGNISISGRHIVKLSPARQSLPKVDRSLVGALVPVPEMPDK